METLQAENLLELLARPEQFKIGGRVTTLALPEEADVVEVVGEGSDFLKSHEHFGLTDQKGWHGFLEAIDIDRDQPMRVVTDYSDRDKGRLVAWYMLKDVEPGFVWNNGRTFF